MAAHYGRFRIIKLLGEGAQGRVYLAHDPRLDRSVAIKALTVDPVRHAAYAKLLVDEARTVSRLSHPNIVTLFDAGEERGQPYLVFEYVEGTTLRDRLRQSAPLPRLQAVDIAAQLLEGIGNAHRQHIIHRDLKPANIMLDSGGRPRVMDFGIATTLAAGRRGGDGLVGTPLYVAPEYITSGCCDPRSDVFAVGVILYEMLTGRTPVQGATREAILQAIVAQPFVPPSTLNPDVDERLDGVVLRALAKDPQERFDSADAFALALRAYLAPAESAASDTAKQSTLEFLLRRMRHKSDFPALSEAMRTISRLSASDQESVVTLSEVILRDFALTNKLLKVVNAAVYRQFGGVSTISRAVVVLGFDAVRSLAATLILFNHLQNATQAAHLKNEVAGSLFGGAIARALMQDAHPSRKEEACICAMFHDLGRLLATFYFHDETLELRRLMEQERIDEAAATQRVLGIGYEELGVEIARQWSFPERLVQSMRSLPAERVARPLDDDQRFRAIANLACDIRRVATETAPDQRRERLHALSARYDAVMRLPAERLATVVERALGAFAEEARALDLDTRDLRAIARAQQWARAAGGESPQADARMRVGEATDPLGGAELTETLAQAAPADVDRQRPPAPRDAIEILSAGIQDITNTLVSDYTVNDVLRMVIEAMYRGIGFSHVLLCIRDPKLNLVTGRFGLGDGVEALAATFRFPLNGGKDMLQAALALGKDVFINDARSERVQAHLPTWFRERVNAPTFVLFPLIIDKKPVGLLYADHVTAGTLSIGPKEAGLLTTLRNQAVLVLKQRG